MADRFRLRAQISTLFDPASIVVLGASASRRSDGNAAVSNLVRHDHADKLAIVHPSAMSPIQGIPTFASPADLPNRPDVALVSLPAASVVGALRSLEAVGCTAAVVPTAGFNAGQKAELLEFIRGARMVVHGPNNMGLLNFSNGLPLWFYDGVLTEDPVGSAALIAQSGSASFAMRAAEDTGFSKVITSGNEYGLTSPDYMDWLADDDATTAVGLVLESIRDVGAFIAALKRLRDAAKPVVVLKVGRTESGSRVAAAHTEALVSRGEFYTSLFERYDVPQVRDYDELASALMVLTRKSVPQPRGKSIAFVTDSGGQAGLISDLAHTFDLPLAKFSETTIKRLQAVLPGLYVNNPLDAGGSPKAVDHHYSRALQILSEDPDVDAVAVVVEAQIECGPIEFEFARHTRDAMKELAGTGFPVFGTTSSTVSTSEMWRRDLGEQIPLLRGYRNTAAAVEALSRNTAPWPVPPLRPAHLPTLDEAARLAESFNNPGPLLDEAARALLTAYRLEPVRSVVVHNADDLQHAHSLRYPAVVKVISRDVPHRADVGGVIVGVVDVDAAKVAIETIHASVTGALPDAVIDGYEVQSQVIDAVEVALGAVGDPGFGGIATVGSGGALVELYQDVATSAAPLSVSDAEALLRSTVVGKVLDGYRNVRPATDPGPVAQALSDLSWLIHDHHRSIAAIDLNPVLVEPASGQISIVDLLVVVADNAP